MQAFSYNSDQEEYAEYESDNSSLYDYETDTNDEEENYSAYDYDNDYENYYADTQHCYDGTEQHPEFTKRHSLPKNMDKSIKQELKKIGFPVNIIAKADEIFNKLEAGTKRGKRRRQMMFFCVKTAYNALGIPEDPNKLAKMCGITRADISKAQSMCAPTKTSYKAPIICYEPSDFLNIYYQKIQDLNIINFSDGTFYEIKEICEEVMEKDEELYDEKPQTVAAAVIVFYLSIHGLTIEKKRYKEIFGASDMTVNKLRNRVAYAYND